MSSTDLRARHRGLSHHTRTVLELLLAPVTVVVPAGVEVAGCRAGDEVEGIEGAGGRAGDEVEGIEGAGDDGEGTQGAGGAGKVGGDGPAERHEWLERPANLDGYLATRLPSRSMGREDPLFFAAALAAGSALAEKVGA
jgi:hypothetical protein